MVEAPVVHQGRRPLRVARALISVALAATLTLGCDPPAVAAPATAHDVARIHEAHGHHQWRQGRGDRGHRWSDYQRQARQLNRYLRAVAAGKLRTCGNEPHCAVRLASYLHRGPYRLIDRVVQCESNYRPEARSPISSAGGLFQFLEGTWRSSAPSFGMGGRSRFEVWPAAWVGSGMIAQGGIGHWNASRHCWS